jgi:hypothetical protein
VEVVGPATACLSPLLSLTLAAGSSVARYLAKYRGSWRIAYLVPFPAAAIFDTKSIRYLFPGADSLRVNQLWRIQGIFSANGSRIKMPMVFSICYDLT